MKRYPATAALPIVPVSVCEGGESVSDGTTLDHTIGYVPAAEPSLRFVSGCRAFHLRGIVCTAASSVGGASTADACAGR
eukprot:391448-Rhodomonas_salina.4